MIKMVMLEPKDTILGSDWCRSFAFSSKWVRVRECLGPCWEGKTIKEFLSGPVSIHEFIRCETDLPVGHTVKGDVDWDDLNE